MCIAAPQGRKHLSADALFRLVRRSFANITDDRGEEVDIPFTDALRSACAMVSLQSPALLAFDNPRVEGNLQTIQGMPRAPCDTRMRERREPVSPASLRPSGTSVFRQLQRGTALEDMGCLDGHSLVARAGTGYCSSPTMHCVSCLHKVHRNGSLTYYHPRWGAARIHPDCRAGLPLMPEPMITQDGTEQNDWARHAAKRFLATLRRDHPHRKGIITADSLRSHAPHIETLHDHGCHYILGVTEGDQASGFKQVRAAEEAGRVTSYDRHDRAAGVVHRVRLVNDMPLNASRADRRVHVIDYWAGGPDKVPPCSWVTDVRGHQRNVYPLMGAGRARGKIDNEPFNTLQNQGDNFEHNDGHGEQNLSVVLATMLLLAFVVDQPQQLCGALCRAVWTQLGRERLRALCDDYRLESMCALWVALLYGFEKPRLIVSTATSSIPRVVLTCRLVNVAISNRHGWGLPKAGNVPVLRPTCRLFCSPFDGHQANTDDQTAPLTSKEEVARR